MATDKLHALKQAQARVNRCRRNLDTALAERDSLVVAYAGESMAYREMAEATRLSTAAIGKIAKAGGIVKYPPRARKETTTP
jgi:type I site-specific restriction-modification system R (restriction) subunit